MLTNFHNDWLCGPGRFFGGTHWGGLHVGGWLQLLIWGLALYLLFKIVVSLFTGRKTVSAASPGPSAPLAILEKRYAEGDIDREEFVRRKEDLQG